MQHTKTRHDFSARALKSGRVFKTGHATQVKRRGAGEAVFVNTLTDQQRERVLGLLRQGKTLRSIERETGHRRETIAAYGRRAGLLDSAVKELAGARESISICEPHRELVLAAILRGASLRALHAHLVRMYGFSGSYSVLKRYASTLAPATSTARMLAA